MPVRAGSFLTGAGSPDELRRRPRATAAVSLTAVAELLGLPEPTAPEVAGALPVVTGVSLDSRTIEPGDLFAAIAGAHIHRADLAADAVAAGAVAVLTDARGVRRASTAGVPVLTVADPRARLGDVAAFIYGRPAERLLTIGVTGTNGKTTTTYLIESGLRAAALDTGLIGTIETRLGDRYWANERTTPEAPDLQALLAVMLEEGARAVTMEVSSHALVLGRVDGIRFDVAVFTNLGIDHLDFHHDLESYFAAKASLFTPERSEHAVVNVDDPYGRRLAEQPKIQTTTYSADGATVADWRVTDLDAGPHGSSFTVMGPGRVTVDMSVSMPGGFNVANALAALVALVSAGLPLELAAAGIAACTGVPGRMETIDEGQSFGALVDYAHTPDAVSSVLATLRPLTVGRLVLVLGCGGDRDRSKRPIMGEVGARHADVFVITDDNPRSEDPSTIRAAMLDGAYTVAEPVRAELHDVADRATAIAEALGLCRPDDVLVIAGRGHETSQEVGDAHRPLDDREVLREALRRTPK